MNNNYEVAIIGGGIIGMATAYYLSKKGIKLVVIEKEYIGSGSTGRCIGGIRQQFSNHTTIRLMKQSIELFSQMEDEFGFNVEFYRGGYLLLAHEKKMEQEFIENIKIQHKEKINVSLLSPDDIKKLVPHINTDGIISGAFCPDDGQAFPFAVLRGYKKIITENRGDFLLRKEVVKLNKNKIFSITLEDGTKIEAEKVLLSTGPWTRELGEKVGLDLPLYAERHEAMITERMPKFFEPMIVDYRSDGCYFHQLINGQVIGCYTPVPNVPGIREDASFEFLPNIAWRMTRLVPSLKNASVLRHWGGCYTMTPDGNPVLDESEIEGLYVASGMSGHGFMFGPAMGKHLSKFIVEGKWDMDFKDFSIKRSFKINAEYLK